MYYIQHHLDRRQSEFCYIAAFKSYDRALDEMITWSILNKTTYYVVGTGKKHPILAKRVKAGKVYEYNKEGKVINTYN